MTSFQVLKIVAIFCLSHTYGYSHDTFSNPFPTEQNTRMCGEWHNTNTGGIYYKPFEPVVDNERCVWIIAVPGALSYKITLQYLGTPTNQPGSDQELLITGVTHNGTGSPIFDTRKPLAIGEYLLENVNLVVVTFASANLSDDPSTGFAFLYETGFTGDALPTSPLSTHHLFESPTFEFHYPNRTGNYDLMELAAFVFPPANNIYTGAQKHIYYKYGALQGTCRDSLYVYTFNKAATGLDGKWAESGQICSDLANQHVPYEDIVLILFQSDAATVYSGFWFWFTAC